MRPDPDYAAYQTRFAQVYDMLNADDRSLAGRVTQKSHDWLEAPFGPVSHFGQVLEVGAGTGQHLLSVRHGFDRYVLSDASAPMLERSRAKHPSGVRERVAVEVQDAARLTYADATFDRLIAAFVLEHLERPHEVLREWNRVVKPGGVISIALPCDPGLAWRLGRRLGPRRKAAAAGLADYDYWMAREHINPIGNLVTLIRYYFESIQESWFPARLPWPDINLFYQATIRKGAGS